MNGDHKRPRNESAMVFVLLVFLAFVLRLLLIPNPGFEADISFWKSWGLAPFDHGIVWSMHNTNNNYPTPFAYLLWVMTWIYSLFADPHNFNEFWSNANLLFLTIAKMVPILADFGIAGIILWIGKHAKRIGFPELPLSVYCVLSTVYLLSPISLIDGAWWGQVDSLGVVVFLLALVALVKKQPLLAGIIYMTAMMTKLQNMIYGPLFFLLAWQLGGYPWLVKSVTGAVVAFFGLNIEFFLARDMGTVIQSLTVNYDYFPLMSLNAYNLWWIVAAAKGMQVSDKLLAVGIMNAKTVGLVLFASVYLFALLRQLFHTHMATWLYGYMAHAKPETVRPSNPASPAGRHPTIQDDHHKTTTLQAFLESLILVNGAFFLFQTESHDRYAFPLSVFLLLWAPFYLAESGKGRKQESKKAARTDQNFTLYALRFTLFYSLFTLFYFYNLHSALVANYPNNGLPILKTLTAPWMTMGASAVQLLLFAVFLAYLLKHTKSIVSVVTAVVLFTILFLKNSPLFFKKPVSLTTLTPYISQQEYSRPILNMPVNANLGFAKWSPLSVQYAFYRKGIGTHANSFLEYDIGGHFRKFTSDYGIDTEAGGGATATFEIYGDGRKLFFSEKMGRYTMPRHVEVDITGVKKLGLITTDAGDGRNDDHTDWLRPTLWP